TITYLSDIGCLEIQGASLWIMPDEVDVATVVKVIDTCPSGALKYRHK
ncbi:(4Fe-4S)-binding protein, partial [Escherichia coli]|nr:(4Fe-4S)-binding protein [Escherichia coli]